MFYRVHIADVTKC